MTSGVEGKPELQRRPSLAWYALLFLAVAVLASLPRFGQRENDTLPISDSDLYMEMARFFTGDVAGFTPKWVQDWAHHYNRPLLPFLAGWLAKLVLADNLRAAFSLLNIVAAASLALLMFVYLRREQPNWRLLWLPSLLFLTAFPQLNWGYHILTDTAGYATAMAVAVYGAWLIKHPPNLPGRFAFHALALFLASAVAFLTRETGWFAVIAVGWVAWGERKKAPQRLRQLCLIMGLLVLGKVPHSIYSHVMGFRGVPVEFSLSSLLDWRYLLDFVVKTGVCFNLSWLIAFAGALLWLRARQSHPPLYVGWALAATLYTALGYVVNKIHIIGYPLRLSYAVFPIIFFWLTSLLETRCRRPVRCALIFFLAQAAINLAGVFLDPGQMGVKAIDVLRPLRNWLGF